MKRISRKNLRRMSLATILCLAGVLSTRNALSQSDAQTSQSVKAQTTDDQSSSVKSFTKADSPAADSITESELKRHIDFLASDTLQGREAGMQGNYAAGAYIVDQLRKSNVPPITNGEGYFHYFHPNFRNILAVIPGQRIRSSRTNSSLSADITTTLGLEIKQTVAARLALSTTERTTTPVARPVFWKLQRLWQR